MPEFAGGFAVSNRPWPNRSWPNSSWPAVEPPLLDAVRRTLRRPGARAALHCAVPEAIAGAAGTPARRQAARTLLQDAARQPDGVLELEDGSLLLLGAEPAAATRLLPVLEQVFGAALATTLWHLPADGNALLAWAEARPGTLALQHQAPRDAGLPPVPAGLDAELRRVRLARVLRRTPILRLEPDGSSALAGLRLAVDRARLAAGCGALHGDAALLRHVAALLAGRTLAALADPAERLALLGSAAPDGPPLHLDLPASLLRGAAEPEAAEAAPASRPALVATLHLADAANPSTLAALRSRLRRGGWALAVADLAADTLALISPGALEADWFWLRWSPALAERPATAELRRLDPDRVILSGIDAGGEAALRWARSLGIASFAGAPVAPGAGAGLLPIPGAGAR